MLNGSNIAVENPRPVYRLVRAGYLLVVIGALNVGMQFESAPVIALGGVLFVGFFPASRWLADRLGIYENDERTQELIRTAASRALYALFAVGFAAYVLGAIFEARGGVTEPLSTVLRQGEVVLVWTAAAAIGSSVLHKGWNLLRARRLEA